MDLDDRDAAGIVSLRVKGVRAVLETGSLRHHRWDDHTQIYFRSGWIHAWAPPLLNENLPAEVEIYYGGDSHAYERPLPRSAGRGRTGGKWKDSCRQCERARSSCRRAQTP